MIDTKDSSSASGEDKRAFQTCLLSSLFSSTLMLYHHILYFLAFPDLFLPLAEQVVSTQAGTRPYA